MGRLYPAAVLLPASLGLLLMRERLVGNICGGRSNGRRVLLSGFCGVGLSSEEPHAYLSRGT